MSASEIKPFKETGEHSYHRRAFSHDYFAPFIYHLILKKLQPARASEQLKEMPELLPAIHVVHESRNLTSGK
ncbi:MAG: hypothetical protein HDR88_02525 [Bacteroides sp.]|nr:hypothetical protein [Bacteroides sp.]